MSLAAYAVLFDLDGTLLNTADAYLRVTRLACRSLGWPLPGESLIREVMLYGRSTLEVLFGKHHAADPARRAAFRREVERWWESEFPVRARVFPDVFPTLRTLSEQGFRLGIVTDADPRVLSRLTAETRLPPMDAVVTHHDVPQRKPSPRSLREALRRMGLRPESAVYVGDHAVDLRAGKTAGVRTVGLRRNRNAAEILSLSRADLFLTGLGELPSLLRWVPPVIEGSVRGGSGRAGDFLSLPWVEQRVRAFLGASPYPGTLNLSCSPEAAGVVRRMAGERRVRKYEIPPQPGFCRATCYEVRLAPLSGSSPSGPSGRGLLLRPDLPGYPPTQLEILSREHLRSRWGLRDGDQVAVRYLSEPDDPESSENDSIQEP